MSTGKKMTTPVWDMKMSTHFGVALGAEALFGIKIKDKLCWPPAQVDGDDTVEKCPTLSYRRINADVDLNDIRTIGAADPAPCIDPNDPQIMTGPRDEYISEPELFGGDTNGTGGVRGLFSWLPGKINQVLPTFITSRLKEDNDQCPSYRGLASVFFSGSRKPTLGTDQNGLVIGGKVVGKVNSSNNQGFVWGVNDPYVPNASLRVWRRPKAEPLRKFAEFFLNPYNVGIYPGKQWQVLAVQTPLSPARRKPDGDDGEMLPRGGGFPGANPAAVLYELVSSGAYEISATEDAIDKDSFLICARRLAYEDMGISFAWVDQDTVREVVNEVCKHVGAAVFIHPKTGLYTMRLLRPETDFDAIQSRQGERIPRPWVTGFVLDPSNAELDGDFERKTWTDVVNSLTVKYTDDETSEENAITVQNQVAIAAAGGRINDGTMNGYMFRSEETAHAAGVRELGNISRPILRASWNLSRKAWSLAPFDVITVNWPSEGLVGVKFRIMSVDYGTPRDRTVKIDAVQDVFGDVKPRVAYVPQAPLWRPDSRPTMRQPWFSPASAPMLIRNGVTIEEVEQLDEDQDAAVIHMISSDGPLDSADAFVHLAGESYSQNGVPIEALPRAVLGYPLPAQTTTVLNFYELDFGRQERDPDVGDVLVFVRPRPDKTSLNGYWQTIGGGRQSSLTYDAGYGTAFSPIKLHWGVGTAAMALDPASQRSDTLVGLAPAFHEEVCVITALNRDTGDVTVRRGCWDTVPAPIPSDAWVFHMKNRPPVPRSASPDGEFVYSVYRPKNASAVSRGTTQQYSHVATARQAMPARPGNVRLVIGGETHHIGSKPVLDDAADVTVRWASRNRMLDDASPAAWTAGNITPESGQSHYVRVWRRVRRDAAGDAPAVLVAQFYNLGGDSYVVPATVFTNSMTDPDWNPGQVESDIEVGAAFVIEVGAMRMTSGTTLGEPGASAQMSAQAALMLLDVGTAPGGWGNRYGEDYGGAA